MITVDVTLEGITPMLQNRFTEKAEAALEGGSTRRVKRDKLTPREAAEKAAYRLEDGTLWHPSSAIVRMLREAGAGHKLTGSRKSAKFAVAGAIRMIEEHIRLHHPDTNKHLTDFEVDSRRAVNPSTKGAIMAHRPRHERWATTFTIKVNDLILDPKFIYQLFVDAGESIGIGDYRPEKGGPFGTFAITKWEEHK